MTQLPRHLAQWNDLLSLFAPELALPMAELLLRLDGLFGHQDSESAANDEIVGFDGFTRRAPLSRLVPSEWLLQQEVPTEFVRRYEERELSYFQVAHEAPKNSKTQIVLIDAGPQQLGRPRIVQLALLILLARRAKESQSEFYWGAVHEDVLHSEISQATVRAFLSARSLQVCDYAPFERRYSTLEERHRGAEFSFLGSRRNDQLEGYSLQRFEIDEDNALQGATRLRVARKTTAKEVAKEIFVDAPSDEICVKLLRDPFETRVRSTKTARPRVQIDPKSQIAFRGDGKVVYVLGTDGELISFSVPAGPKSGERKRTLPRYQEHTYWGVGTDIDGHPVAVSAFNGVNYLLKLSNKGGAVASAVDLGRVSDTAEYVLENGTLETVLLTKSRAVIARYLHWVVSLPNRRVFAVKSDNIAAALTLPYSVEWLTNQPHLEIRLIDKSDALEPRTLPWDQVGWSSKPKFTHFGGNAFLASGALAFEVRTRPPSQSWAISDRVVHISGDVEVVGLGTGKYPSGRSHPCLIVLGGDKQSMYLVGPELGRDLFRAESLIVSIKTCPFAKTIAFTTEDGGFGIYSTPLENMLYQYSPKDRGDD